MTTSHYKPTQARLKELFDYDPNTGFVTRKIAVNNRARTGERLARKTTGGYIQVCVDRRLYALHHLIWVWVYGEYPHEQIDHINRVRDDNRLSNLRPVTHAENMRNKATYSNNKSGMPGVMWYPPYSKWIARIGHKGKKKHLGYFDSLAAAKAAYLSAKQQLHHI